MKPRLTRFGNVKAEQWLDSTGRSLAAGNIVRDPDGREYVARGFNTHVTLRTPMVNCKNTDGAPLVDRAGRTCNTVNVPARLLTFKAPALPATGGADEIIARSCGSRRLPIRPSCRTRSAPRSLASRPRRNSREN